jgi:DNA-binding transcriptional MerR regulator
VTARRNSIDHRPFRSKAEHRLEEQLEAQYRGLAIPEIVAVLASRTEPTDYQRTTKVLPAG